MASPNDVTVIFNEAQYSEPAARTSRLISTSSPTRNGAQGPGDTWLSWFLSNTRLVLAVKVSVCDSRSAAKVSKASTIADRHASGKGTAYWGKWSSVLNSNVA